MDKNQLVVPAERMDGLKKRKIGIGSLHCLMEIE
jgi:hypothetical protein